jgi:peroxiredoxin
MRLISLILTLTTYTLASTPSGSNAPDFTLKAHDGSTVKLSDFKDKHVVLEWFNDDCPYVVKHYSSKNMQSLQKEFSAKGVVWLTVSSSAKGKQGYLDADTATKMLAKHKGAAKFLLLDHDGKVGKAYGAKTTPHMYVIDPKGILVYQGAIDDNPSADVKTVATAKPLFKNALNLSLEDKAIAKADATTKPYGCSVKY